MEMKIKNLVVVSFVVVSVMLLVSCASSPKKDINTQYVEFKSERPKLEFIETADPALNNIQKSIGKITKQVNQQLDSYYTATEKNPAYVDFLSKVKKEMELDKNLTFGQALIKVENALFAVENAKNTNVKAEITRGLKSMQVGPTKKIRELNSIASELVTIKDNAKKINLKFDTFDSESARRVRAMAKVTDEIDYLSEILRFLIEQYKMAQQIK